MTSNAKQEVKEGGSLATVEVKGGIFRTSVASGKPPAISARKRGTLQGCVALLEISSAGQWVTQAPKQKDNDETALIC